MIGSLNNYLNWVKNTNWSILLLNYFPITEMLSWLTHHAKPDRSWFVMFFPLVGETIDCGLTSVQSLPYYVKTEA